MFFLILNYSKNLTIYEIEEVLNKLSLYLNDIKKFEQISVKKKNKILNVVNEVILFYNELLMDKICKEL